MGGHCSDCMVACVIEKGVNICFKQYTGIVEAEEVAFLQLK